MDVSLFVPSSYEVQADPIAQLLLTPFRTQNTPPPMSSYQIQLPHQPVHVAFSHNSDSLAVLLHDGSVQVWDLNTRLPGPKGSKLRGGGKVAGPTLRWEGRIEAEVGILKQICMDDEGRVAILCTAELGSGGVLIRLEEGKQVAKFDMDEEAERLVWDQTIKWGVLDRQGNALQCELRCSPQCMGNKLMTQYQILSPSLPFVLNRNQYQSHTNHP
jgi:elongator complex protein 1